MELATDTRLKFQLSTKRLGSLQVYATSNVGQFSMRLAEFSPSDRPIYNETLFRMIYGNGDPNARAVSYTVGTVCMPRGSHRISFVASALNVDISLPGAVIKDVVLTDEPCTVQPSPGNTITTIIIFILTDYQKGYVCRASHWPCVIDFSGSPPTGLRPVTGR